MSGRLPALPAPRTPPSADAPALRWGVLGTGWIAERFVASLQRHTRQEVLAVGSRGAERAAAWAGSRGVPRAYGSYEDLVADPDVDVVYVATPHPAHHPCARLALGAGKHVLVEKPLALDAGQGADVAALAAERGLFCMEALWSLFLPRLDVVRQVLESGLLGDVRTVTAEYGERFEPGHRILRQDLAGGPLLDLGTYPIAFATWVLGAPEQVVALGQPHPAGVNGQLGAVLADAQGNQALVHTTLWSGTAVSASVAGTRATLTLPQAFPQPGDVVVTSADLSSRVVWTEPAVGHDALHFQAAEVARRVAAGERESPLRPLSATLDTLRVMDEIRRQVGITFDD